MSNKSSQIKFIDFCAGIGGGKIGLEKLNMRCVGYSEIDKKSIETYKILFGEKEKNYGDLMKIDSRDLPSFDLMIAGFPCQTFSIVGPRTGMNDDRGLIIFGLIRILKKKKVKYFILENVKGLSNHENGDSLTIILNELDKAGYQVNWKVLNSLDYGVPQMRERLYLVGVRKDLVRKDKTFEWPEKIKIPKIEKYLINNNEDLELNGGRRSYKTFLKYLENKYNRGKFDLKKLLKEEFLVMDTRQSDLRLYRGKVPTLRTGRHGVLYVKSGKIRMLSGYEALLLQGFSKNLARKSQEKVDNNRLLSQAGNAMTVNVVEKIGKNILNYLDNKK